MQRGAKPHQGFNTIDLAEKLSGFTFSALP
jgi:hypothetical protein